MGYPAYPDIPGNIRELKLFSIEFESVVLNLLLLHHDADKILHHCLRTELLVEAGGIFLIVVGTALIVYLINGIYKHCVVALYRLGNFSLGSHRHLTKESRLHHTDTGDVHLAKGHFG